MEEIRLIDIGDGIGNSSMEQWGVASSCGGGGPGWLLYPDDDEEEPQLVESVGRGGSGGLVGVRGSSGLRGGFPAFEESGASFSVTRQLFEGAE